MANSSAASSRRSPGSSAASLARRSDDHAAVDLAISVDTLVNHLLVAKRSLSSMTLVLRADELVTAARQSHEDSVILAAQTGFLHDAITDQVEILERVNKSLLATYDWGKRDFRKLVRRMDEVDNELEGTMEMLRGTGVQSVLRPTGEERRNLLDFVDEGRVHAMRDGMKKSIQELQAIQLDFDTDLLHLDTDIRNLSSIMNSWPPPAPQKTMRGLMLTLFDHSSSMADLLASLTKHFDMCVTAIRTTEGAAALARRKAAEVTQSQGGDSVSISGVFAEHESNIANLEPETAEDRAEMLRVVIQDAQLVEPAVQDIQDGLAQVEQEYAMLEEHTEQTKRLYLGMLAAYAALGEIGDRLAGYLAAEEDFRTRWETEKDAVFEKLEEMKHLRSFYEGYASAYGSLLLEVERRRTVEEKVQSIWRKAQESVDKILEADRTARGTFRQEVGEFLPTDLWAGMQGSARRWKVVQVNDEGDDIDSSVDETLRKSAADVAKRKTLAQHGSKLGKISPTEM